LDPYRGQVYFPQAPLPPGTLRDRIAEVMVRAQVSFSDIRVESTSRATRKVQAYFAGQGPTRTIVLSDNLLRELSEPEIVAVVAHEAGHLRESQWPRRVASAVALLLCLLFIDRLLRHAARRGWFGATEFADIRTLPLISLTFYAVITFGGPIAAALSREGERQADRYAVELTGDPATYASMLRRAARINKIDPSPPIWIVLGQSHPPMAERLEQVER
jgi:STE24 endopeptidase